MSTTTAPRVGDRVTINCPASVTHGQTGTVTFAEARWGMTASDGDGMVPCERCGSTGRVEVQR